MTNEGIYDTLDENVPFGPLQRNTTTETRKAAAAWLTADDYDFSIFEDEDDRDDARRFVGIVHGLALAWDMTIRAVADRWANTPPKRFVRVTVTLSHRLSDENARLGLGMVESRIENALEGMTSLQLHNIRVEI